MSLVRLAPSAEQIAVSRCRDVERASRRLATFVHAINNTKATAPRRSHRMGRNSRKRRSTRRSTTAPTPELVFGYSVWKRSAIAFISAWACSNDVPGFNLARTKIDWWSPRSFDASGSAHCMSGT